jgi:hypothetical protein
MIARYIHELFIGALVERRILLGGLAVGAIVLTFAVSTRHGGPWHSDAAPSAHASAQPPEPVATPTVEAAPAAAAVTPPPAVAPAEPVQSAPDSAPDGDNGDRAARGERAAERGARTR